MQKVQNEKSKIKNVFIYTDACDGRNLDARKICEYFKKNNYNIINTPKEADYIILFTCAYVNGMADRNIRAILKFKKFNAELIVAGCLPEVVPKKLQKIFDGKTIIPKNLENIDKLFYENSIKLNEIDEPHFLWHNYDPLSITPFSLGFFRNIIENNKIIGGFYGLSRQANFKNLFSGIYPFSKLYSDNSQSFYIAITRGCNQKCAFCNIIPAIGPLKSKPLSKCIDEFKQGLNLGYTNFVLEGDDVGHYGQDIGHILPELLDEITKIDQDYTISLKTTNPKWIFEYIVDLERIFKRKKISSILLSIQSGNNNVLKRMRRLYSKEELIDIINRLKKADSDLMIKTYFIVGFPGELREEFRDTIDLIEKTPIDYGNIFSYTMNDGAEAIDLFPKISNHEKKIRMRLASKLLKESGYVTHYSKMFKIITFHKNI